MTHRPRAGFTLLELIVVMGLLALLAGVVLPSVGTKLRSDSRRATLNELELLADAALQHYHDTDRYPADALELLASSTPGWAGPYLVGTVDDPWSAQSGYAVDAFGTPYRFRATGVQLSITSDGEDRAQGGGDDLSLVVDATPVLRGRTSRRLSVVNTAIQQYNSVYLATAPLPADWSVAYSILVSRGFLPLGGPERDDAWGTLFVADPLGVAPLVRVRSTNL